MGAIVARLDARPHISLLRKMGRARPRLGWVLPWAHRARDRGQRTLTGVESWAATHRRSLVALHLLWMLATTLALIALASQPVRGGTRLEGASLQDPTGMQGGEMQGGSVDLQRVDASIVETEAVLSRGFFRTALVATDSLRRELIAEAEDLAWLERRARVEILAATALMALHRTEAASAHVSVALEAMPDLELDPIRTPRKVHALVEQMRAERGRRAAPSARGGLGALETRAAGA